jgi:hypothetical protein
MRSRALKKPWDVLKFLIPISHLRRGQWGLLFGGDEIWSMAYACGGTNVFQLAVHIVRTQLNDLPAAIVRAF